MTAIDNIIKSVSRLAPSVNLPKQVQQFKKKREEELNDPFEFTNIKPTQGQQIKGKLSSIVESTVPKKTPEIEALLRGVDPQQVEAEKSFDNLSRLPSPVKSQINKVASEYLTSGQFDLARPEVAQEVDTIKGLASITRQEKTKPAAFEADSPKTTEELRTLMSTPTQDPEGLKAQVLRSAERGVYTPEQVAGAKAYNQQLSASDLTEKQKQEGIAGFEKIAPTPYTKARDQVLGDLEALAWGIGSLGTTGVKSFATTAKAFIEQGQNSTLGKQKPIKDDPFYKFLDDVTADIRDTEIKVQQRVGELGPDAQFSFGLGSGISSLGVALAMTAITKDPWVASAVFGDMAGAQTYQEAIDSGASPEKAMALFAASAAGNAYLEKVGLDALFKNAGRAYIPRLEKAFQGFITESQQEGAQQVLTNFIAKVGYDNARGIFEGYAENALIGGITGAGGAAIIPSASEADIQSVQNFGYSKAEAVSILNHMGGIVAEETNNTIKELDGSFKEGKLIGYKGPKGKADERAGIETPAHLPENVQALSDLINKTPRKVSNEAAPPSLKKMFTATKEAKNFILNEAKASLNEEEMQGITKPVSREETLTAAQNLDITKEDLAGLAKLSQENKNIIVKAGAITSSLADNVSRTISDYATSYNSMTPEARVAAEDEIARAVQDYKDVYLATREIFSEAGRALRSTAYLKQYNQVAEEYDRSMSSDEILEMAKKFVGGNAAQVLNESLNTSWMDKVMEVRNMGLVSNPTTHYVNMVSNLSNKMFSVPDTVFASLYNAAEAKIKGVDREVFISEIKGDIIGSTIGLAKGVKAFGDMMLSNSVVIDGKLKDLGYREYVKGPAGEVVRVPGKLLQAEDAIFKEMIKESTKWSRAFRIAAEEGLKGPDKKARILELVENPTNETLIAMEEEALRGTFQEKIGALAKWVNSSRTSDNVALRSFGKLVFPFVNTPANIFSQTIERSPLAPLFKSWREEFNAGGVRRAVAMGRMASGTAIMGSIIAATLNGAVTGAGPEDANKKKLWERTGWQEYSIKIGDKYYSYKRLEPIGTLMGWTATMTERFDPENLATTEEKALQALAGFMEVATDKSFITGTVDLVEFLNEPMMKVKQFVGGTAASFVPFSGAFRFIKNIDDKIQRKPAGILDYLWNNLPGISKMLAPSVDIWGREVKRKSTIPFATPSVEPTIVDEKMKELGLYLGVPTNKKLDWKMGAKEYSQYLKELGQAKYKIMEVLVSDPGFNEASPVDQYDFLEGENDSINEFMKESALPKAIHSQLGLTDNVSPELVYAVYMDMRENIDDFKDMSQKLKEIEVKKELKKIIDEYNKQFE